MYDFYLGGSHNFAVTRLFDGWEFVEPGVEYLTLWRPDPQDNVSEEWVHRISGFGGVGRKT
jgi:hypothetical protein